jgi:hypothetical protein
MFLLSVVYLVVQFTLATLGWGGFHPFFSHPQFVALAVLTVVLMAASFCSGVNINSGVEEDRSNRWVIGALGLIGLLLPYFPAYTDRLGLLAFGGMVCAGSAWCCSPRAAFSAYGQFSYWASGSAGWWLFRKGTGSSPPAFTTKFATQAIWAC